MLDETDMVRDREGPPFPRASQTTTSNSPPTRLCKLFPNIIIQSCGFRSCPFAKGNPILGGR